MRPEVPRNLFIGAFFPPSFEQVAGYSGKEARKHSIADGKEVVGCKAHDDAERANRAANKNAA